MNQQEPFRPPLSGASEKKSLGKSHYYVQVVTEQVFVVRMSLSLDGKPEPNDRIIRSFDIRHDAYSYASTLNDEQPA